MKHRLDLNTWNRREHFDFFRAYEEPFFGITVEVDMTRAYEWCKAQGQPISVYYLHKATVASNEVAPFRYRIEGEDVYVYDAVHMTCTVGRPDGTFGFSYMPYARDYATFAAQAQSEITRVRHHTTGLFTAPERPDVLHCSALPWLRFKALSHARRYSRADSCPKISFGQLYQEAGFRRMPVSIHVHHALVDGLHVGQWVAAFERLLNHDMPPSTVEG